jgi:hypothetical protein
MNPNYREEILAIAREEHLEIELIDLMEPMDEAHD